MATNKQNGSSVGTFFGILIGLGLFIVGLYGIHLLWYKHYLQFQRSQSWDVVPCMVNTIQVSEAQDGGKATLYTPIVEYSYQKAGKEFVSNRFWFGAPETPDKNTAIQATGGFQTGGRYDCFVSGSEPSEAVLVRQLNPAGGFTFYCYAIAAAIGTIMLLGQIAGLLFLNRVGRSSPSEINYQRAMANGSCPTESGEPDQPLIIEAAESRAAVAIGLWIAGVCWTGIMVLISAGFLQNRNWIPILFLSLFVLAGVAVLVFAFYSTLQIFNPKPILASSQRDLFPGSEFELSWMFRGDVKKIQHLEIVLEGIEKVSYRQGTDNRTEERPFFRQKIVDSKSPEQIAKGFELVSMPLETMHSFKSTNNSFTWQIRVLGKIAMWPDIRDRFEIVVLAPRMDGVGAG